MKNGFQGIISRLLSDPGRIIPAIRRRLRQRKLSKNLIFTLFSDREEFAGYKHEIVSSGLLEKLQSSLKTFDELSGCTDRGAAYDNGVMSTHEGIALYALTRKLKPAVIVETGVCIGYSSALILQALHLNQ